MKKYPPKYREGDFIESIEGLIFDVKGLVHPPNKVVAFVRYIQDPEGDRERDGVRYRKVYSLVERGTFLRKHFPYYLIYDPVFGEELIEVPIKRVVRHYSPSYKLAELRSRSGLGLRTLEEKVLDLVNFLVDSTHVPRDKFGVSGSVMVGMMSASSDVDLIVYGLENAKKVDQALTNHFGENKSLKKYSLEMLKTLYKSRCKENGVSFEDYVFHEQRKTFQGFFHETEFFVRYVKDRDEFEETYGKYVYASMGQAKIKGVVTEDSDALFTPCSYGVANVNVIEGAFAGPISTIVSFRGRFCQQVFKGERIVASGKLEKVIHYGNTRYRLILGNHPEDFMVAVK